MPVTPTYPGVYIEEVASGVRTITGVATSVTAFVGFFSRGPMNQAVRILSLSDFERQFGGLRADSLASYAIDQFFLNGGSQAYVVRTAAAAATASVILTNSGGAESLWLEARSPGVWGNNLRVDVDYGTSQPTESFNLTIREVAGGKVLNTETFRNLTMAKGPRQVSAVVNDGSKLLWVKTLPADPVSNLSRPAATGTVSDILFAPESGKGIAKITGKEDDTTANGKAVAKLEIVPRTMAELAATLQAKIRAGGTGLEGVTATTYGNLGDGATLSVRIGGPTAEAEIAFEKGFAKLLGLDLTENINVKEYVLGGKTALHQKGAKLAAMPTDPNEPLPGSDGSVPGVAAIETALRAFDKVDLFNILCLPDLSRLSDADALALIGVATAYCEKRRAFFVVDPPQADGVRDEPAEIEAWLVANGTIRHKNLALYYPRPLVADPLDEFRLRAIPVSGSIAGLYARTDTERGVWKAPAGLDARLRGVQALEYLLSDDENGVLNPLAINCLRNNAASGNICWGARTLAGSDLLASEWKYVPVRRLALFLEESLYRGTQWVVFEPNDEALWAQIRLNLGAFLHSLFRQGAFQGQTAREAYLVKCDKETTTQDDINRGIVNIVVGFAPLKPAEFVILKFQQLAGQIAT